MHPVLQKIAPSSRGFKPALRAMHGIGALIIITALSSGYIMADTGWNGLGIVSRNTLYMLHKSLGALAVPLLIMWFCLRLAQLIREGQISINPIKLFHIVLFSCSFLTAALGLLGSSAGGFNDRVFILSLFPNFYPEQDIKLSVDLHREHKEWAYILLNLLGLHFVGALFHLRLLREKLWSKLRLSIFGHQ